MGVIFQNGFGVGTVPNNTGGGSGQWYLATGQFGYQPGWNDNVVSWPMTTGNYGTNYGTINPNEILSGNNAGIYINILDSAGTVRYDLLSALVGQTGTITFTQGGSHITFGFVPGTFSDSTVMFGSISWGMGSQPLTLISTSNTTFTGYADGDSNSGGPLTYVNSGIAPNNTQLVNISYTTDAPAFTLNLGNITYLTQRYHGYSNATDSGFTCDGDTDTYNGIVYTMAGSLPSDIATIWTNAGLSINNAYVWNIKFANSETIVARVALNPNSITDTIAICPIDQTNSNWKNGSIGTPLLGGTFNFPASFTLYKPTTQISNHNDWC